jgi:hypothetical protein
MMAPPAFRPQGQTAAQPMMAPPAFRPQGQTAAQPMMAPPCIQACKLTKQDRSEISFKAASAAKKSNEALKVYFLGTRAYKIFSDHTKAKDEYDRAAAVRDNWGVPIAPAFKYYKAEFEDEDGKVYRNAGVLESTFLTGDHWCQKNKGWEKAFKNKLDEVTDENKRARIRSALRAGIAANLTDAQFLFDPDRTEPLTFIDVHVGEKNSTPFALQEWLGYLS